jgi:ABC-2 type transport system permease protein
MTAFLVISEVTVGALLGRRRTIVLLLLAGLPVLIALLARLGSGRLDDALEAILELGVRSVLPLTALVFGTSALGSEIEDGTAVYIIAKPIPRWQIAAAKIFVAGLLAAALNAASTLLTGLLIGGADAVSLATTIAFAVAMAVAAFAYAALFVALSLVTGRALIVGLLYTLVWEGILAGILEGTRLFSIREATLTLAEALAPDAARIDGDLDLPTALVLLAVIIAGGFALSTSRLRSFEVRGTE